MLHCLEHVLNYGGGAVKDRGVSLYCALSTLHSFSLDISPRGKEWAGILIQTYKPHPNSKALSKAGCHSTTPLSWFKGNV